MNKLPAGLKYDNDKLRWDLMPFDVLEEVVRVLEHGSQKYSDDNWKKVDNHRPRYFSACLRHVLAWWQGEQDDKESGLPHLAHAICCLIFLLWKDKHGDTK